MKSTFFGLCLAMLSSSAFATLTFPVDVDQWRGKTGYLIVPTDVNEPYQLRYLPGASQPHFGDWPRADGGDFGIPLPTVEGEPDGLVYPVLRRSRGETPAHDQNLERIEWGTVLCGPDAADLRQNPGCGVETDVITDIPAKVALDEDEVLRNANNRAYLLFIDLEQADGWEMRERLQDFINAAKHRELNLPTWASTVDQENWQIQVGYYQDIRLCLSDLKKKIRCKYDSNACDGTQPVGPGDFDSCWPAVPVVPELP